MSGLPSRHLYLGGTVSKRLAIVLAVMLGMLAFAAVASAEPKVDSSQQLQGAGRPHRVRLRSVDSVGRMGHRPGLPERLQQPPLPYQRRPAAAVCSCSRTRASIAMSQRGTRRTSRSSSRRRRLPLGQNYMVAEVSTDGNNSTTEDTLFLDPADCNHPVNGSTTWVRADFTGFTGDDSARSSWTPTDDREVLVRRDPLGFPELRDRPPRSARGPQVRRDREPG